jgi:hypothetical protein
LNLNNRVAVVKLHVFEEKRGRIKEENFTIRDIVHFELNHHFK